MFLKNRSISWRQKKKKINQFAPGASYLSGIWFKFHLSTHSHQLIPSISYFSSVCFKHQLFSPIYSWCILLSSVCFKLQFYPHFLTNLLQVHRIFLVSASNYYPHFLWPQTSPGSMLIVLIAPRAIIDFVVSTDF